MVNYFKSSVYHLFHGHETPKDPTRFDVFNKHKEMDKQEWIEYLMDNYSWGTPNNFDEEPTPVNDTLLYAFSNTTTPMITICIVNYLRYNLLTKTLNRYKEFGIPLNIILWVNDSDKMDKTTRTKINNIGKSFNSFDVTYCTKNMGTGYPRFMMLNKAYHEYDTPYIMTSDDDILFDSVDSLIMGTTILHQPKYKDFGAIGLWCSPQYNTLKITKGRGKSVKPKEGFHRVDTLGAATMTIRRDIIQSVNVDPNYIIGLVDWDFCMGINKLGHKLGLLCDQRFKPDNLRNSSTEYTKGRWNEDIIQGSKDRFMKKWNIKI